MFKVVSDNCEKGSTVSSRIKKMPTCQRALSTYVLTCQRALSAYVFTCKRAIFNNVNSYII